MAEATHSSTQSAAEHGGGFPPFQTETFASQLIWLAITFGLLYYLMSKVALPRVAEVLQQRSERIGSDLAEAEAMRGQAQAAGTAYESFMGDARAKAKAIALETRNALATESDTRRKALEADLAARMEQAEATIRTRTDTAMASVRGIASETAAVIVERLTGRNPDAAAVAAATDRTLSA